MKALTEQVEMREIVTQRAENVRPLRVLYLGKDGSLTKGLNVHTCCCSGTKVKTDEKREMRAASPDR